MDETIARCEWGLDLGCWSLEDVSLTYKAVRRTDEAHVLECKLAIADLHACFHGLVMD